MAALKKRNETDLEKRIKIAEQNLFTRCGSSFRDGMQQEAGEPLMYLGEIFYQYGQYDKALYCFDEAIRRAPNFSEPYAARAATLVELGLLDAAHSEAFKALKLNNSSDNNSNIGCILLTMDLITRDKPKKAIYYLDKAISLNPDNFVAYRNKGAALIMSGKFEDAYSILNEALTLNPEDLITHVILGDVQRCLGKNKDAEQNYRYVQNMINYRYVQNMRNYRYVQSRINKFDPIPLMLDYDSDFFSDTENGLRHLGLSDKKKKEYRHALDLIEGSHHKLTVENYACAILAKLGLQQLNVSIDPDYNPDLTKHFQLNAKVQFQLSSLEKYHARTIVNDN